MTDITGTTTSYPKVGDRLPVLSSGPVSRRTLALYAAASGYHNPLHIDIDAARAAGFEDVFPHGMLLMAYVGRLLTDWAGPRGIISFDVRFSSIAKVGDDITLEGEITALEPVGGQLRATVAVTAKDQTGAVKLSGEAVLVAPRRAADASSN